MGEVGPFQKSRTHLKGVLVERPERVLQGGRRVIIQKHTARNY